MGECYVEIPPSSGVGEKSELSGMRRLTRQQFFEINRNTCWHAEVLRDRVEIKSDILFKITQHSRFAKYTPG